MKPMQTAISATINHMHRRKSHSNINLQSNILAARQGAASFGKNQTLAETQKLVFDCVRVRACERMCRQMC